MRDGQTQPADQIVIHVAVPPGIKGRIEALYLRDGQKFVGQMPLEEQTDAGPCGRRKIVRVLAENADPPGLGTQKAHQDFDQRGFSHPVLAQQAENFAPGQRKIEIRIHGMPIVGVREISDFNDRVHGKSLK